MKTSIRFPGLRPVLALVCLGAVLAGPTRATMTEPDIDLPWLWANADCVIEATVTGVSAAWTPGNARIETSVQLDVTAVYQGPCTTGPRTLKLLGGAVDSIAMVVKDSPSFSPGEHVLLFLDERPGLFIPTLAMGFGKMTVAPNPMTGGEMIGNRDIGWFDRGTVFAPRTARKREGQ